MGFRSVWNYFFVVGNGRERCVYKMIFLSLFFSSAWFYSICRVPGLRLATSIHDNSNDADDDDDDDDSHSIR